MKLAICAALLLAACGSAISGPAVMETRMAQEPPREPTCKLDLITADITSPTFMQQWELVGYVTARDASDPNAPATHEEVRPHACAMGGTAIALAMSTSQAGAGIVFMVLHPKAAATGTSTF